MPAQKRRWPPEKIEAMRTELLTQGKTLDEIGEQEGVSGERIRQLVGNLNRGHSRAEDRRLRIQELYLAGKTDAEIAAELRLTVGSVAKYRQRLGFKRPKANKRWTEEKIIEFARRWYGEFGSLSVADWSPAMARRLGHEERIKRFYQYHPPHVSRVQYYCGSFNKMKRKAGIPLSFRSRR